MDSEGNTCPGCGAEVDSSEEICPFCGRSLTKKALFKRDRVRKDIFSVDRDRGTIDFGDGVEGRRPSADGSEVRAGYRRGTGGNVPGGTVTCQNCGHVQSKLRNKCEKCGARIIERRLHFGGKEKSNE